MLLKSLHLKNFKAIKALELEFTAPETIIKGKNGTGKTSVCDAYYWLLTDKTSQNKQLGEDIKVKDEATGNPRIDGGIEHSVTAVFNDGAKDITIKKVFIEKWTKKHGETDKEFGGHVTKYFVDDVPKSKKLYDEYVANTFGNAEQLKQVISTTYFNELKWDKQRTILLDLCGDVTDDDVINSRPSLAPLKKLVGDRSIADYIEMLKAQRKQLNKELDTLPVRIDENNNTLNSNKMELEHTDTDAILKDLLEKEATVKSHIEQLQANTLEANLQLEINQQKAAIEDTKRIVENTKNDLKRDAEGRREKIKNTILETERLIKNNRANLVDLRAEQAQIDTTIKELRAEYNKVFNEEINVDTECPTCGQQLPPEKVRQAKDQLVKAKDEKLQNIVEEGKKASEKSVQIAQVINKKSEEGTKLLHELEAHKAKEIEALKEIGAVDYAPEVKELLNKLIDQVNQLGQKQIELSKLDKSKEVEFKRVLEALQSRIVSWRGFKDGKVQLIEQLENKIEDLRNQLKELGEKSVELNKNLDLANEFITAKVKLLTDSINKRFIYARFKLFDTQINGGLNECCEAVTVNGSTYNGTMSNGEKIKIGIDIANTLGKAYGINMPMFIDNAESITGHITTEQQVIKLFVSDEYDVLTI